MQVLGSMYRRSASPWKHATGQVVAQSVKRQRSQLEVTTYGMFSPDLVARDVVGCSSAATASGELRRYAWRWNTLLTIFHWPSNLTRLKKSVNRWPVQLSMSTHTLAQVPTTSMLVKRV